MMGVSDPAQTRLAELETLSNLLGKAQAVETSLPEALHYILQITGRAGGLIYLHPTLGDAIRDNPAPAWLTQIDDPASPLRLLIDRLRASQPPCLDDLPASLSLGALVPIGTASAQLGALLVSGAPCSPAEVDWLCYLGRFLGRVIERQQLFAATQDRSQELAALHKIASTLTSTLQLDEILSGTTDGIRQILNVEAASLLLLDETRGELVFKKTLGGNPDWIFQYSLKVGQGLVGEAVRSNQAVLINNVKADPRFYPELDSLAGLEARTLLCAPLITRGQTLGAMAVINKRNGPFNLHDQELLESMTASVANAIYNARLFHQLTVANAHLEASRWEVIRSRSTLQALFDGIPHPIYIVDRDYRLVAVNLTSASHAKAPVVAGAEPGPLTALTGAPANIEPRLKARENERHALLGRPCYQTLFGQTQPCAGCRIGETLAAGQNTQRAERRWDTDGQPTEWEISTHPIFDENGQTLQVIIINQDVTEKHRLETSLAQSEKMAAVGQLAAGVAHEINNPLAAIIANTQLLQRDLPADDERQESLELIGKAGDRALRVVRNLLDFARQDRYEFSATDVNDTLQSALDLIAHQLHTHSIDLQCKLAPDLPLIQASHDHLQGVWLNLLLNARDALAGQSGTIWLTSARQSEEVRITVADTGMGIPPEKLSKIFEPFYTTKQAGQGTGLGLSLCQRIIKQHSGRIQVDSQVGQGTVFTVILPIGSPSSI
jgi:two-component system, NtrC family, sensor kinase